MRYLIPHAVILLALVAIVSGHEQLPVLVALVAGHLAVPIWAAATAPRDDTRRSILLGPGLVIAAHLVGIVATALSVIGGVPEDTWIVLMLLGLWASGLVAYIAYCAISYALVRRARR